MNDLKQMRIEELESTVKGLVDMIRTEGLCEESPTWRYAVALAEYILRNPLDKRVQ